MARTKRGTPYKSYWGMTKQEMRDWIDNYSDYSWAGNYKEMLERDYLMYGTDAKNFCVSTRPFFNRVHRIGRRIERDKLRPQYVMDEDFDFDDSRYRRKYKGVWWEIY